MVDAFGGRKTEEMFEKVISIALKDLEVVDPNLAFMLRLYWSKEHQKQRTFIPPANENFDLSLSVNAWRFKGRNSYFLVCYFWIKRTHVAYKFKHVHFRGCIASHKCDSECLSYHSNLQPSHTHTHVPL